MKKILKTEKLPPAIGPYSSAVKAGNFIFLSGQVAYDVQKNIIIKGDVEKETQIIMENISAFLKEQNLTFENVVKTTIFLKNMADFGKVNEVYEKYFKDNPPARSCVSVKKLPKDVSIEIEMIIYDEKQ